MRHFTLANRAHFPVPVSIAESMAHVDYIAHFAK